MSRRKVEITRQQEIVARENWYRLTNRYDGFYSWLMAETGYERPHMYSTKNDDYTLLVDEESAKIYQLLNSPHYETLWKARNICKNS